MQQIIATQGTTGCVRLAILKASRCARSYILQQNNPIALFLVDARKNVVATTINCNATKSNSFASVSLHSVPINDIIVN
jgi:hypothetical protein